MENKVLDACAVSQAEKFERWLADRPAKPPCAAACPTNTDIQSYVSLVGQGKFKEALDTIRERCTLAGSLGRICHHPCESACRRNKVDAAVSIRLIKRFAADACKDIPHPEPVPKTRGKRVAIIGGGPSGLAAAYDLVKDGFDVTIFEQNDACGGALYTGIPKYRLPKDVVAWDVEAIRSMGVTIKTNTTVGKDVAFNDIVKDFNSVLIAVGLSISRGLPIPGADAEGVLLALPFLKAANFDDNATIGKKVVVIGGGNVAFDVARSAKRIGAETVQLTCLECDEEMPAHSWEIEEARDEGIEVHPSWGPREIKVKDGKVAGMTFKRCTSVFDNGTFSPKFDECELFEVECDNVIIAIGQGADISGFEGTELSIDPRGRIAFNPATMQTNMAGVFACGEVVTGPGSAAAALNSGHRAATAITRYLETGKSGHLRIGSPVPIGDIPDIDLEPVTKFARTPASHLDPSERVKSFDEMEFGFDQKTAMYEAQRCMNCGAGADIIPEKCAACLTCVRVCPFGAPYVAEARAANFKLENCQACGICAAECPGLAIDIRLNKDTDIEGRIAAGSGSITMFTCQYGLPQAISPDSAKTDYPNDVNVVSLMCHSRIDVLHILKAFEAGTDGVLVADCPDEGCRYSKGTNWAKVRVARTREVLKAIGIGADRLELVEVGSTETLANAADAFKEKLRELGPNPLKSLTPVK